MKNINPDILKYPIITDKTTKNLERNIYYFSVAKNSNKKEIKETIESIFKVKVKKINTSIIPPKTKTIGRFKGRITKNKKAVIQLHEDYSIDLFGNKE